VWSGVKIGCVTFIVLPIIIGLAFLLFFLLLAIL
jgi:hypothetical protein